MEHGRFAVNVENENLIRKLGMCKLFTAGAQFNIMQSTIEYLLVDNLFTVMHVREHIRWTYRINAVVVRVADKSHTIFRLHCDFDRLWRKAESTVRVRAWTNCTSVSNSLFHFRQQCVGCNRKFSLIIFHSAQPLEIDSTFRQTIDNRPEYGVIQIQIDLHQDDVLEYQMNLGQFGQRTIDFVFIESGVTEFVEVQFGDVHRLIFVLAICFNSMMERFTIVGRHFFGIFSEWEKGNYSE